MSDDAATNKKTGDKGPLTLKGIKRRLEKIKGEKDDKKARRSRARLYEEALRAIAGGTAKNPGKFAAAALEGAPPQKSGGKAKAGAAAEG